MAPSGFNIKLYIIVLTRQVLNKLINLYFGHVYMVHVYIWQIYTWAIVIRACGRLSVRHRL